MCCWYHLDWIHDWTQLIPLDKLSRVWWEEGTHNKLRKWVLLLVKIATYQSRWPASSFVSPCPLCMGTSFENFTWLTSKAAHQQHLLSLFLKQPMHINLYFKRFIVKSRSDLHLHQCQPLSTHLLLLAFTYMCLSSLLILSFPDFFALEVIIWLHKTEKKI